MEAEKAYGTTRTEGKGRGHERTGSKEVDLRTDVGGKNQALRAVIRPAA